MEQSKLIQLMEVLSTKEKRKFAAFVKSPFFNKNEMVNKLHDVISGNLNKIIKGKMNMEAISREVFSTKKFNAQKLRYLMTDLTKLLEDYMAYEQYHELEIFNKHLLLKALNEKGLNKYFQSTHNQAVEINEKSPFRDSNYFYYNFLLEDDLYNFRSLKDNRNLDSSLKVVINNLDVYYMSRKIKYACEVVNRQNVLAVEYDSNILEALFEQLKKEKYQQVPAIAIYHSILLTLTEGENESHYVKLKKLLAKHGSEFPKHELKDMYDFTLNYCIKMVNNGNTDYMRELFDIYNIILDKKIIFDGEDLSPQHMKNIVTVGLRLNEFDRTEALIQSHKDNIHKAYRENSYHFNMASVHFYRKEYGKALRLLQLVEYTDVYFHLDAKALLLKTYYESDDVEPLISLIESFKSYLRRNKEISDYQNIVYMNFAKYLSYMVKYKLDGKYDPGKLKKEISETKKVADIGWLFRKLDELIAGSNKP